MNNKAAQAYIQTKVGTTDQGQLLLLLYDGALRFLRMMERTGMRRTGRRRTSGRRTTMNGGKRKKM